MQMAAAALQRPVTTSSEGGDYVFHIKSLWSCHLVSPLAKPAYAYCGIHSAERRVVISRSATSWEGLRLDVL